MKRRLQFVLVLLLAASAFGYAPLAKLTLPHLLEERSARPSHQFSTNASSIFTLTNAAADMALTTYDGNGNVTQRVWKDHTNGTVRTQTLTWDAFNRLAAVTERDNENHGYNWRVVFDGLGRRVQTLVTLVSNNTQTATATLNHYYDPSVEFLEIGVSVNGVTTWKLYGPDGDGGYGSQQGLGGLETLNTVSPNQSTGVIQDHFGNVLGSVAGGSVSLDCRSAHQLRSRRRNPTPALSFTPLTAEHLAWRGKWRDVTGDFYWGARPYDARRRAFIAFDTAGHAATPDGYSAFGGNPVMLWDPDGRLGQNPAFGVGTSYGPGMDIFTQNDIWWNSFQQPATAANDVFTQNQQWIDSYHQPNWLAGGGRLLGGNYDWMGNPVPESSSGYGGASDPYANWNATVDYNNPRDVMGVFQQEASRTSRGSGSELSWSQQWRYDSTRTFDNALATTANVLTLGTANSASIAFTGSDLWGKSGYSTGQRVTEGLFLTSMIAPVGGLGLRAEEGFLGTAAKRLATGADGAVFWSGIGRGGAERAATWAGQNGGITLESTLAYGE